MDICDFDNKLDDCDLVITGEGRIDNQSVFGKVPTGVGIRANKKNIPTIAIVGSIGNEVDDVYNYLDSIESCVDHPCSLEEALQNASNNVTNAAFRVARTLKSSLKVKDMK